MALRAPQQKGGAVYAAKLRARRPGAQAPCAGLTAGLLRGRWRVKRAISVTPGRRWKKAGKRHYGSNLGRRRRRRSYGGLNKQRCGPQTEQTHKRVCLAASALRRGDRRSHQNFALLKWQALVRIEKK